MDEYSWKVSLGLLLVSLYAVLFYLIFTSQDVLDFSIFYSSCQAIAKGKNPYQILTIDYSSIIKLLPANLNPPILLWLLSPLTYFNYYFAMTLWTVLSLILGLIGAWIAFNYAFSSEFIKKNGFYLCIIYLSFFATLMSTALGQLGGVLLFLILGGYHFYMKDNDYAAGVLWGIIIAIKLFPALLFVYVFVQKRFKVGIVMLFTFLFLSLLPLFVYGNDIYLQYFDMMSQVRWYGKSWNGSIFGIIFRVFTNVTTPEQSYFVVKGLYITLFSLAAILYLVKVIKFEQMKIAHRSFGLTLVMMLLLSPFGWLYYFTILVFPLALTWPQYKGLFWFLCIFFINIPINNIPLSMMSSMADKITIYSFNFYGLLLLLYLISKSKVQK